MRIGSGFNLSRFSLSPFNNNRIILRVMDLNGEVVGVGEIKTKANASYGAKGVSEGEGHLSNKVVRISNVNGFGEGLGSADNKIIRITNVNDLKAIGHSDISCNLVIIIETIMEYIGNLAPGETLTIDTGKFSVELNGQSILSKFIGDLPNLDRNTELTYIDEETNRSINLSIMYREQFI